jgi:DNA-directed RNA polymerase beta subunit/intein/homing endonuclease
MRLNNTMNTSSSNQDNSTQDKFGQDKSTHSEHSEHSGQEYDQYIETPWTIIGAYFKGQHLDRLVRHQLESYNNFVSYQIQKTIDMFNPVHIVSEQDLDPTLQKYSLEIFITFENFHIYRPQIHENNGATKLMFPQEARLRNFTYASAMTIDMNIKFIIRNGPALENIQTLYKTLPKIHIGKLPIMLKSNICVLTQYKHVEHNTTGECKFDAGGYFIINGSEKTVLGQERAAENKVQCFNVSKNNTKYTWCAEVKSIPDYKCISPKQINMYISSKNNGFGFGLYIQLPRIKQPIALFIVFRALGVLADKEICEKIVLDIQAEKHQDMLNGLQASIIDANSIMTQEEAIKHITSYAMYTPINMDKETGAKKKQEFTMEILTNDLFPHCNTPVQKYYFLGYMANKLLQASFNWIGQDDRDSYLNKRIDLTGALLNNLFRNYFNKLVKDMEKQVIKEINTGSWKSTDDYLGIINQTNIYKIIKSTTIENGLKRALSTGDFGIKNINSNKVGVAQVLNRLTYISSLSHARRISTPTDKSGKLIPPRKLHNTSWGFCCVTGDTEVLMSNRLTIKQIKNMKDGDVVNTVNPETLLDEPSDIHSFFSKMPDKLFEITTISGRKIKATSDHPFLVNVNGKCEWKKLEDLQISDKMVIRHTVKQVVDNETYCGFDLLKSIVEIEPELVYDFTTRSDNHSFVASSFVCHNCPAETPEGQSVGIVKNLSYMAHITIHSNIAPVYEYVTPYIIPIQDVSAKELYDKVKVFINGSWIGIAIDPIELYKMLKDKKQKGIINIYTAIIFDYKFNEIRVCNDSGRLTRPLLRVKNNDLILTKQIVKDIDDNVLSWDDLLTTCRLEDSVLEYIDAEEQSWSMISVNPRDLRAKTDTMYKYTHCEIHPSTMFGVAASCIPFPEHNQSPRNTYQCAMSKQAMGIYVTNYEERMDKTAYILNNPTRPLVDTRIMNMIELLKIPSGSNVIVAIMTHTGYNQEDSLLFNKGSIDRGLFQATIYHTEKDEDKQNINGDEEIRCKPDPTKTKGMKFGNYGKVNNKGLVPENTLIENRDVIIAKITPIKENRNDHTKLIKYEDQSHIHRTTEETYIDKNYIDRNGDGYNFAKVRLRNVRKPVIGDKFSSRHGQKGTIGNIIPEQDMPFTKEGVRPDIIINPHAIPSRMTIGQLKETLLGKVLINLGLFGDGTSFGEYDVKTICKELSNIGFESNGNEIMYNALTGEQLEGSVFIGPVFYQRLKHMVTDKQHSRSIGPMVNLTRQPAEGRSRDGGLRFGEMERDCEIEGSPLALSCGISIKIETMEKCISEVLGWSDELNGLVKSKQSDFMYKGERDCVEITLEDGRKMGCTPDHPILTSDKQWIKVKDLIVGESKVKVSVTYPLVDLQEEVNECAGWSLQVGSLLLTTGTPEELMKTMAFARILSYLITDGNIHMHSQRQIRGSIFLGHMLDVETVLNDLRLFCETKQTQFISTNYYIVRIPSSLMKNINQLSGILKGKRVKQPGQLPDFIMDDSCPRPIIREFLGGLFGADGHTCYLGMHREKRDLLTSISFSQSKQIQHLDSLQIMMENIKMLLGKCGIHKVTLQNCKENSFSKKKNVMDENRSYQMTLHLDISELISFSEKIGFRHCCHKSQRLEAGVSYKRLRTEVTRQHNWLVNRVDEITKFKEIKSQFPNKIVHTKKAILQAVEELKMKEALLHKYAIPSTHDITDHLIKETEFGKFTATGFPNAEEFLKKVGAYEWFMEEPIKINIDEIVVEDEENIDEEEEIVKEKHSITYGVNRCNQSLPTMDFKVMSILPIGKHKVYDIQVDDTHSFLVNGLVAHNCMISHGAASFTRSRMYDASDKYQVYTCKKCGLIASYNDELHIHHCKTCDNRTDFAYVEIPYACKLLFQELITMNIAPRILTT